ncbi:MAG: phosphotransferase [Bacillota bacterium]|jgi:homoserine kinase type II
MNIEGKLRLKEVNADDFGAMRSKFVVVKNIIDELHGTSQMAMSRSQLNHLMDHYYHLGEIVDAYEIFGGYTNRAFGVIIRDKDGNLKDYFVRKYNKNTTAADIIVEHKLVDYSAAHGMGSAINNVIRTVDGQSFVQLEEEKEGKRIRRYFAVYTYLQGDDDYDWINTKLTPGEDRDFAKMLARFHNSINGFNPGEKAEPKIMDMMDQLPGYFVECNKLPGISPTDRFDMLFNDIREDMIQYCEKVKRHITAELQVGMPQCVCHCDVHPGNVKWDHGKCIGMFDFDWAKLDYRLFDICYALMYTCASWDAQTDGTIWLDRCGYFLDGYTKFLNEEGTLTTLTDSEKKAFPYMMLAACLYLVNWCTCYYDDFEGLNEFEYFYYLAHTVKMIHFVDDHLEDFAALAQQF